MTVATRLFDRCEEANSEPISSTLVSLSNTLAIIPARGGSRAIPRKNLVMLDGKPLIVHSIEHAQQARSISRVVVSTEDEEIARVALAAGAEVPFFRPVELAGDEVLDQPVFAHVLAKLEELDGCKPEFVVHLRPTAPRREPAWIDDAIQLLANDPQADSVRSVSAPSQHPYRMFRIGTDGYLDPLMKHEHPEPYLLRRQDLPPLYYYNCVIDVTRPRTILEMQSMTGARIRPYVMNPEDVLDIDTPLDLRIARSLMEGTS
jgi:N-acylneuraminate cytidylyltransferase